MRDRQLHSTKAKVFRLGGSIQESSLPFSSRHQRSSLVLRSSGKEMLRTTQNALLMNFVHYFL
jgi:hypothetical protein